MILPVHDSLRAHLAALLATQYALDPTAIPALTLEYPPNRDLGDLGTPVAFELARRLRKAPRAIAQEIASAFGTLEGIRQVAAAPNGYLNFFLERPPFLLQRLTTGPSTSLGAGTAGPSDGKAIVEHTAINPNKAAHIGHLRNSALGDTLVRVLRFRGTRVEVQNYIDDTGVQVADVVVGLRVLENLSLDGIKRVADTTRFDFYCWDLYARVTEWYDVDQERLKIRAQTLHDIEHGGNESAEIAAFIADRVVRRHLETMARMNVDYDLLTWEGDILRLKFWAQAFEVLKEKNAVYLQTEGRLAGCWVMPIDEDVDRSKVKGHEAKVESAEQEPVARSDDEGDEREKVIVRSNGVVTYVGKDIAYQFWKLGLLGRDFKYRVFANRPQGPLWATSSHDGVNQHPPFGGASYVYNVIDVRQSYLQKLLKQALIAVGHPEGAERSHHFSYEMVALSHATARELGFAPPADSEEAKRPFVEVSGRKGLGVKADDLLDAVIAKAGVEVGKRNAEMATDEVQRTAEMIGIAAVRYFLIKFSRGKVIAFDLEEALNFEGESGPYIQYAVVRANKIFQNLKQRDGLDEAGVIASVSTFSPAELLGDNGGHELWNLVLEAARLDEVVEQVIRTLEFSVLAKYAFLLAQAFSGWYNLKPASRSWIVNEEREDVKHWRAAAIVYVRNQLTRALDLMGIGIPQRM